MSPKKKDESVVDEIVDFLRKHVNGKTLYTDEITYSTENGRFVGTYSDQKSLSNMHFSETKYTMDKFIVSKEKVIDTETGEIVKDEYSSSLYKYSISKRQSTGEVTGIMTHIASSSGPVPADSTVWITYDLRYKKNEFTWIEEQMLYMDRISTDGRYRPAAYKAKCRLFLTDEGLVYEFVPEFFDVDPATQKRTPSDSKYPKFVSVERRV